MSFFALFQKTLIAVSLIGLSFMGQQPAIAAEDGLKITKAWVRMAPPVLKTHGAYLTIVNEGKEAQELVAAASDNYDAVEIHLSRIENGIATMQRLESIKIPAGGQVEFKPGGIHLMLIGPRKPLEHGAIIPIRLGFRNGVKLEGEAIVMHNDPDDSPNMKEMDHSGHGSHHTN